MDKEKIKSFRQVCVICHKLQKKGKKIVFCHGFFDILHAGHVIFLKKAKKLGDYLVVCIDNDKNASRLKGKHRPVNNQKDRLIVISGIEYVDYCFVLPDSVKFRNSKEVYFNTIYKKLNPDFVISSSKASQFSNLLKKDCETLGIGFLDLKFKYSDLSTTKLIGLLNIRK